MVLRYNFLKFSFSMQSLHQTKKLLVLAFIFLVSFSGCSKKQTLSETSLPLVVTSFYPLYELAQTIGDGHVRVINLVPAGVEPHDYEPTPQDLIYLHGAKLLIYNGLGLEPWASRLVPELESEGVLTLEQSSLFDHGKNYDPHFWLDPIFYSQQAQVVAQKLQDIDPAHTADYQKNLQTYLEQITELNAFFENGLKVCKTRTFVTNHAAFGYLASRYHLTMIPISGLSPEDEPSLNILASLANLMKKEQLHYVLVETLLNPKVGESLAKEAGAKTLVLNPLEGLNKEETAAHENYFTIMKQNLQNLRTALECT